MLHSNEFAKIEVAQKTESGFKKYEGKYQSSKVLILSNDIGSAFPTQDLSVFISNEKNEFELVLSIPFQKQKSFECNRVKDKINVFTTEAKSKQKELLIELNLPTIIKR